MWVLHKHFLIFDFYLGALEKIQEARTEHAILGESQIYQGRGRGGRDHQIVV